MSLELVSYAATGNLEKVKQLVDKGKNLDYDCIHFQNTTHFRKALTCAVYWGHTDVVEYLIQEGADVNFVDNHPPDDALAPHYETTALAEAVLKNHPDIVKVLLDAGADPDFVLHFKKVPFYVSASGSFCDKKSASLLESLDIFFEEDKTRMKDMLIKAKKEKLERSKQLLEAIEKNDPAAVQELLEKGVDLNYRNKYKESAFDLAKKCKNAEIISLLKKHSQKSKSCFVATVIYQDIDCEELRILRQWRDTCLKQRVAGRWFIQIYYQVGYEVSNWLKHKKRLSCLIGRLMDMWVDVLRKKYNGS